MKKEKGIIELSSGDEVEELARIAALESLLSKHKRKLKGRKRGEKNNKILKKEDKVVVKPYEALSPRDRIEYMLGMMINGLEEALDADKEDFDHESLYYVIT